MLLPAADWSLGEVVALPVADWSLGEVVVALPEGWALVLPEMPAVPLSSPVLWAPADGVVGDCVVVVVSVEPVVVWARAPNADKASASALRAMIFT